MYKHIKSTKSYRSLRAWQISLVFALVIALQELILRPHIEWAGFALMMVYGGFDNGTTWVRASHRFIGVMFGLFFGFMCWFLGHLDFRLQYFVIPIDVFCAYFFLTVAYRIPTIFTTIGSIIGYGYFNSQSNFVITYFLLDYGMATIMAISVCVLCEYFWFRRYHLMRRYIREVQETVLKRLYHLVALTSEEKIKRLNWYHACIATVDVIYEMHRLLQNAQFVSVSELAVGDSFNSFSELTTRIYVRLKALYYCSYTKRFRKYDYNLVLSQVTADLELLKQLLESEDIENRTLGVMNAAQF